jgi:hypothetical protein
MLVDSRPIGVLLHQCVAERSLRRLGARPAGKGECNSEGFDNQSQTPKKKKSSACQNVTNLKDIHACILYGVRYHTFSDHLIS